MSDQPKQEQSGIIYHKAELVQYIPAKEQPAPVYKSVTVLAFENPNLAEYIRQTESVRDTLLSQLQEIVIEAFDYNLKNDLYTTHDPVQSMLINILVANGRMRKKDYGWFEFTKEAKPISKGEEK